MDHAGSNCCRENENGNCSHCAVGVVGRVGESKYKNWKSERCCSDDEAAEKWALLASGAMRGERGDAWVHK
jgi:hypothetical protein